ncbi:MAG: twin-arginine translocase subunit TatC [Pseudomonadota bacterium]|jgi:sec-independent protein translocase protein TatC|nr:twin-arginine translocase subunit TatC [Pseudomonadota bacterium]
MSEHTEDDRDPHDVAVDSDEQPFLDHLIELRARILRSFFTILILFVPIYYFANDLYGFVAAPLMAVLPEGSSMIATQVATPFITPFKLAIYAAIFLGVPFWLHQLWSFVSPGLYRREKKFAVPLLLSSVLLFYCGMAFVYFLVFPLAFTFFVNVSPEGVPMMTDIAYYLDFVLKMVIAFGFAFEIPIATMLLALTGLSTAQSMAHKRPYVIVGCFVVGMLLTPPDVVSQLLLALPTWLLFEFGILMARLVEKRDQTDSADS